MCPRPIRSRGGPARQVGAGRRPISNNNDNDNNNNNDSNTTNDNHKSNSSNHNDNDNNNDKQRCWIVHYLLKPQ